jgi:hypothetical protein
MTGIEHTVQILYHHAYEEGEYGTTVGTLEQVRVRAGYSVNR